MDSRETLERPGIDPDWTMDGPGMDITHLYLTILYQKRSDSLSLELQAYFLGCSFIIVLGQSCLFIYLFMNAVSKLFFKMHLLQEISTDPFYIA